MYKTGVPDIRGGALFSGAPAVWHGHPDIRHGTGHHAMADRSFFILYHIIVVPELRPETEKQARPPSKEARSFFMETR